MSFFVIFQCCLYEGRKRIKNYKKNHHQGKFLRKNVKNHQTDEYIPI